jgi:transposase InsO family protein
MLTVIDQHAREPLNVTASKFMRSSDVFEAPYPLFLDLGKLEYLRSNNGPEFSSEPFKDWLTKVGIKQIRIFPGSPWENGYNERFNGTLRREVLNTEWFGTTRQAQTVINQWLKQYNQIRPHQALRMRPPAPETILEKREVTGP